MEKRKLVSMVVTLLVIGGVCVDQATAEAVDEYNLKCAKCHGEDGLGHATMDGSDCSLKTVDEIIECYSTISTHDYVEACDEICIEETNTYIFDSLLLEIGKGQYEQMCAVCHGADGMDGNPLDGSHCVLDTLEDIVDCYPGINAHASISGCEEACVWNVNRYIFVELLDNADIGPAADDAVEDVDAGQTGGDKVNNDNWVSCFISSCQ